MDLRNKVVVVTRWRVCDRKEVLPARQPRFPVYPTNVGLVGMAICYDRRFPETFRCLALNGAVITTVSYNTPHRDAVFGTLDNTKANQELLIRGGAAANGMPIVAAGKAGIENGEQYSGGSCVLDHLGNIVAKARTDGDELVAADLDLAAAERFRKRVRLVSDRRPETYSAISRTNRGPGPITTEKERA